MPPRRVHRRAAAAALLALALLALLAGRALEVGPWVGGAADETDREAAGIRGSVRPGSSTAPAPPAPGPRPRWPGAAPDPPAHPPDRPAGSRVRLAFLFEGDCSFGVSAHCRAWSERAAACDEGDAAACVELGELLIQQSPMQPLWGSMSLERACDLGRQDACAGGETWREWSRFGYSPRAEGNDEPPPGLSEACAAGDQAACGLLEMRRARSGDAFDLARAMASCRAGFRDVCGAVAGHSNDPEAVVAALTAGCDLPDAWLCHVLGTAYAGDCVEQDTFACPAPDPALSARYLRLACELDPEIAPCRSE